MVAYVYILASQKNGTLYVGVTSNISQRIFDHKSNKAFKFTSKYKVQHLVFVEQYENILDAIEREKQLKRWHRQWKINLIEQQNPEWDDLFKAINV